MAHTTLTIGPGEFPVVRALTARLAAALASAASRNLFLLMLCQALTVSTMAIMVTSAPLVGRELAPTEGLATLPLLFLYLSTAATALPASLIAKRIGRRNGFMFGAVAGVVGGFLGCGAILYGSFSLFCLAAVLNGVFAGFGVSYRFAAADIVDQGLRGRAISYVLVGGVIAAFVGPGLAETTRALFPPYVFAGCFLAVAGLALATLAVLGFVRLPTASAGENRVSAQAPEGFARKPAFFVAAFAGMTAYGAMSLVMTATPLAMVAQGFAFGEAAEVIRWHMLGMFLPAFVSGHLVGRFGPLRMIAVGAVMILSCAAINLSGVGFANFLVALTLLGSGWNLMFVGATTLLVSAHGPAEKAKAEGLNDLLIYGTSASAALSSGFVQQLLGWTAINAAIIVPVVLALAMVLGVSMRHKSLAAGA